MITIAPQRSRLSDRSYAHNLLIYDDHGLKGIEHHDSIKLHCIDETASMKLEDAIRKLTVDFPD